jgi:hypothetical protein
MDGPYLERGESILLTTDRVSVNSIQYDLLLTTQNLILIDNTYTQAQPQKIPLLAILSVKGGKTATGDLVITLYFSDLSQAGSGQMNLIFSRYPGEQRERERDEWLKTLMEYIVSARQETLGTRTNTAEPDTGIRPVTRRVIAPEMQPPHTTIIETYPEPVELSIVHDESGPQLVPIEPAEPTSIPEPVQPDERAAESEPEETAPEEGSTISPIIVTSLPQEESAEPVSFPEPAHPEEKPAESGLEELVSFPETMQPRETLAESKLEEVFPGFVPSDIPENIEIPSLMTETPEPVIMPVVTKPEERPAEPKREEVSSVSSSVPERIVTPVFQEGHPEPVIIMETAQQGEPAEAGTPPAVIAELSTQGKEEIQVSETAPKERGATLETPAEPVADITSGIPRSSPPSPDLWSRQKPAIIVTAIIILIFAIAGGAVVYPKYFGTPIMGIFPPQTPVITETTPPVPSAQLTAAPTQVIIPASGVWIRVMYPQNYQGRLGNPGSLRSVTGSGDRFYLVDEENHLVQVQISKTDNSGDVLAVEIYRNGEVITRRTTTSPRGSVILLVDATTGGTPGITP